MSKLKTVTKPKTMYGLRYIADPEDAEYGSDRDSWFTFESNGKTVTKFSSLDKLLYAIMTQLKPAKVYGYGEICKLNGRTWKRYAEMHITNTWLAGVQFYYLNGRKVAKDKSIMWVMNKFGSDSEIYAVDNDGKRTPVYYNSNRA